MPGAQGSGPVGDRPPDQGSSPDASLASLAPGLHRVALMLTGDAGRATDLTARVLRRRPGRRGDQDAPVTALVRTYLRRTRRPETFGSGASRDAGDVLRTLAPRARAASVLRLGLGWTPERAAAALGVRPSRVATLVPSTPGLERALDAMADQQALPDDRVVAELHDRLPAGRTGDPAVPVARPTGASAHGAGGGDERPRARVVGGRGLSLLAVLLLVAALVLRVLTQDDSADDPTGAEDGAASTAAPGPPGDLTGAGAVLSEDGEPPSTLIGLRLVGSAEVDAGGRPEEVALDESRSTGPGLARFAALWCDMPPAQDDNLATPQATLTVAGESVTVPCAGRDGSPPVRRLVPIPLEGDARVRVTGDLPPQGAATLAVYAETESRTNIPLAQDGGVPRPEPASGSVVLDERHEVPSLDFPVLTRMVEIGHDSTLDVFAGRTGPVMVSVDGFPVTDDGDLAIFAELLRDPDYDEAAFEEALAGAWEQQQPGLRQGLWHVYVPGARRTFGLPEHLRPPAGERRTVTVQVQAQVEGMVDQAQLQGMVDHVQVAVADAREVTPDVDPLLPVDPGSLDVAGLGEPPAYAVGHRLVGVWQAPQDGLTRVLEGLAERAAALSTARGATAQGLPVVVAIDPGDDGPVRAVTPSSTSWGVLASGDQVSSVWVERSMADAMAAFDLGYGWSWRTRLDPTLAIPSGTYALALPPVPGHDPAAVLVYARVPFEEFDPTDAPLPSGSWPAGEAPSQEAAPVLGDPVLTVTETDLDEEGVLTRRLELGPGEQVLRVTTRGAGRIRILVDDEPAELQGSQDGWWSSWTDAAVTSVIWLQSYGGPREVTLELRVEGYDEGLRMDLIDGR